MTEQSALISTLILFAAIIVAWLSARLIRIEQRIANKLSRVDAKLDLLLSHSGLAYDPCKNLPRAVVAALQDGRKIEAIKCYREATGVGLKEAKDVIEEVQRRGGVG